MTEELKPCPFCGCSLPVLGSPITRYIKHVTHPSNDCILAGQTWWYVPRFIGPWNTRAPVAVKPLVWERSHFMKWNGDWHTIPTGYTVRCADENGWKWTDGNGAFGYASSDESAKAAAFEHHARRIREALA